jgi:hypothetical protein
VPEAGSAFGHEAKLPPKNSEVESSWSEPSPLGSEPEMDARIFPLQDLVRAVDALVDHSLQGLGGERLQVVLGGGVRQFGLDLGHSADGPGPRGVHAVALDEARHLRSPEAVGTTLA